MKKTPIISLIVPIYNTEKFLPDLLQDIADQSFSDFECLLLIDGSSDRSAEICRSFSEKDKRFTVFEKENEGPSATRNLGIEKSNGDFIGFIDSDDRINKSYLKALYEGLQDGVDVSMCNYLRVFPHTYHHEVLHYDIQRLEGNFANFFSSKQSSLCLGNYIWGKLYRKEIIGNTRFRDIKEIGYEDFLFNFEIAQKSKKISLVNSMLYYYLYRFRSLSVSVERLKICIPKGMKYDMEICDTLDKTSEDFKQIAPYVFQNLSGLGIIAFLSGVFRFKSFLEEHRKLFPEIDRYYHYWKRYRRKLPKLNYRILWGICYKLQKMLNTFMLKLSH